MEREEILAKSRAENKNRDVYEQEVLKQGNVYAMIVLGALATVFLVAEILVGRGFNYGLYALVFSWSMTTAWIRYGKLKQKEKLPLALLQTGLVLMFSGFHIYNLVTTCGIL